MTASRLTALGAFCLLVGGCARKAPGPDECRRFALAMFGLRSEAELRRSPTRDAVDELTRECLVTPFDRELLRCTEETGRFRVCQRAFEIRQAAGSQRMLVR